MLNVLVVGVPGERFDLFAGAVVRCGLESPRLVSYADAQANVERFIDDDTVVRFESTDEDLDALRCYLAAGIGQPEGLTVREIADYTPEPGEIRYMSQVHAGRCALWRELEERIHRCRACVMNSAAGLGTTFDKRTTASVLHSAHVPVPPAIEKVQGFDDVVEGIGSFPRRQVMIKTAHGAGATGAIALRTDGRRWHASTTAMLRDGQLWNTRSVRALNDVSAIRMLVDAVCHQGVHVEQWIPKASLGGLNFDLRVVVIAGVARHVLMRCASGPFTNLHLGAQRGDVARLRVHLGEQMWVRIHALAESAVAAVAETGLMLYAGVDILVSSDWQNLYVLEVNGFGDWHPDVFVDGMDTYDWEMRAVLTGRAGSQQ